MLGKVFGFGRALGLVTLLFVELCLLIAFRPLFWVIESLGGGDLSLADRFMSLMTRGLIIVSGVSINVTRPLSHSALVSRPPSRVVFMYNHCSNYDPIIMQCLQSYKLRYIYKKELSRIPLFGWVLRLYNHLAIDRKNLADAVACLDSAASRIAKEGCNCAIAPEGTRSRTGELLPFKKGPFHLAVAANATIVPVIIRGAYDLLPPRSKLPRGGAVNVEYLDPIKPPPPSGSGGSEHVDAVLKQVRDAFEKALSEEGKRKAPPIERRSWAARTLPSLCWLALLSLGYLRYFHR